MKPYLRVAAVAIACLTLGAEARELKIVALGASQTNGKGVAREDAYPAQLERLLRQRGLEASVANQGVDGDTSADIAARLDAAVPDGTTMVILQPGTNDRSARGRRGGVSEEDTRANVEAMLAKLRARDIKVILLGYPGGGGGPIAKKHGATWFGQIRLPESLRQPDGQHYTREGYALLAEEVAKLVESQAAK